MSIDLDALEARLREYDPEAPKCPRKVEEIVRDRPDYAADNEEYYTIRLQHPCCRPEGHEGECRNTRRMLGWPGYRVLVELVAEVRRRQSDCDALLSHIEALEAELAARCPPDCLSHPSGFYEMELNKLRAKLSAVQRTPRRASRVAEDGRLSDRIRGRLKTLGISQSELREAMSRQGVEVSKQTVSGWSTGTQRPSPGHFRALLDALVVPEDERPEWLNCWSDDSP